MKKTMQGFTLIELVFVTGVFVVTLVGMAKLFIYTSSLAEMSGNISMAVSEAQGKIDEIRSTAFDDITVDYAGDGATITTFDLTDLNGLGYVIVDATTNSDLYTVEVTACWENKYGRVIGEDQNLDGTLDISEDIDGDGKVGSPAKVITKVADY